jgi:hypothetical protein
MSALAQGPGSGAWAARLVEQLEEVMTASRRAMEGLAQVELAAAGCLESSIEQVRFACWVIELP